MAALSRIRIGCVDRTTVWRACVRLGLPLRRVPAKQEADRRRFAYPHRMMMVLADGKHFRAGVRRRKRVAVFFLDDASQYVAHRCAVVGAARAPFDDRALDAIFEIGRGNLRATDDLAFRSLDHAAAAGHAAVSVQHVIAARKDLWP